MSVRIAYAGGFHTNTTIPCGDTKTLWGRPHVSDEIWTEYQVDPKYSISAKNENVPIRYVRVSFETYTKNS